MTDKEIIKLGNEEMKNQYGYKAHKPYYDRGFILGYKKSQSKQLTIPVFSNNVLINYIENDAVIEMPIEELMHEDGGHLTKKEYGKVLLKYLVKELREHY